MEEDSKEPLADTLLDEAEVIATAKEASQSTYILRGTAICESRVESKLGKALTKFIQIYAPNHLDSFLNLSSTLPKPS
jgi:hypothetical protein